MYDLTKATSWNALEVGDAEWGQQHLYGPCTAAARLVLESLSIPSGALCFQGGFGRRSHGCGLCWCVHRLQGLKASWAGSVCALAGSKMNNGRICRDQM